MATTQPVMKPLELGDMRVQIQLLVREMAIQMFRYEGLPEEIDFDMIERVLVDRGVGCFFDVGGYYMILPCTVDGNLNLYGRPKSVHPLAFNGVSFNTRYILDDYFVDDTTKKVTLKHQKDAVLMRCNVDGLATLALLQPIIDKLCYILQSSNINAALTRVKAIIHANRDNAERIKSSIQSLVGSYSPFIVTGEKNNDEITVEQMALTNNNEVEYTPDKYWLDFTNTWDLLLTFLGVNNKMATEKKERLVTAEVDANNASINLFRDRMFDQRRTAVDQINKLFNLNIKVFSTYDEPETEAAEDPEGKQPVDESAKTE